MLESHRPLLGPLFRNELEKLWAQRGRTLMIALLVIVVGGAWLTYRSQQQAQDSVQQSLVVVKGQLRQLRHQLKTASGGAKAQIASQIRAQDSVLQQMQKEGTGINEVQQIRALTVQLRREPMAQRGSTLEQLALSRALVHHGITYDNPSLADGWTLPGAVFASAAMLIFGLVAAGLASDRVSAEFEGRTWGPLLLNAPRRMVVYGSKLAAALTVTWAFMLAAALGFFVVGSILMGMGKPDVPVLVGVHVASFPHVPQLMPTIQPFHTIPQWLYDLVALGLSMITVGSLVTLFVTLSLVTRSTVLALSVSVAIILSGVLAPVVAHSASWLTVIDPAVYLPLVAAWTGQLALQYQVAAFTLETGLVVTGAWAGAAVLVGLLTIRRLDL